MCACHERVASLAMTAGVREIFGTWKIMRCVQLCQVRWKPGFGPRKSNATVLELTCRARLLASCNYLTCGFI